MPQEFGHSPWLVWYGRDLHLKLGTVSGTIVTLDTQEKQDVHLESAQWPDCCSVLAITVKTCHFVEIS